MIDFTQTLSIQNYCLRYFKAQGIPQFCTKLLETGINRIEYRSPDPNESFADIIKQFSDYGVVIQHTFYPAVAADEAKARPAFEFAKSLGHKSMTVNFNLDNDIFEAIKTAEKLADEYDLNLGIHNHGSYHWLGTKTMLDFIFKNTSPRIGICLDTAWAMDAHLDPVEAVTRYADRLIAVHFKDFTYNRDASHQDVVVGTGNLKLPEFMDALRKIDFQGVPIIEYEGEPEDPNPALIACKKAILALA